MRTQFPFRVPYTISQGYADNANNYPEKHHGGLDIVPEHPLADIYPILPGTTLNVSNTDVRHGKGIRVRTPIDPPFAKFLFDKGYIPAGDLGTIYLDHFYWHCHEVTDLDGTIDQDTPLAKEGNTGWVFSGGVQVPDEKKDVPPYPGHHLHLETSLFCDKLGRLNLDKDPFGRINPKDVLQWAKMQIGLVGFHDSPEKWIRIPLDNMERLQQVYEQLPVLHDDYTVSTTEITFPHRL